LEDIMKLIDPDHPFFKPLWIRVATSVLPIAWAGVEFWQNEATWGFIFLAAGLYAGLTFYFAARRS
jgi:hypothetical protein